MSDSSSDADEFKVSGDFPTTGGEGLHPRNGFNYNILCSIESDIMFILKDYGESTNAYGYTIQ